MPVPRELRDGHLRFVAPIPYAPLSQSMSSAGSDFAKAAATVNSQLEEALDSLGSLLYHELLETQRDQSRLDLPAFFQSRQQFPHYVASDFRSIKRGHGKTDVTSHLHSPENCSLLHEKGEFSLQLVPAYANGSLI